MNDPLASSDARRVRALRVSRLWSEFILDKALLERHAADMELSTSAHTGRRPERRRQSFPARAPDGGDDARGVVREVEIIGPSMRDLLVIFLEQYKKYSMCKTLEGADGGVGEECDRSAGVGHLGGTTRLQPAAVQAGTLLSERQSTDLTAGTDDQKVEASPCLVTEIGELVLKTVDIIVGGCNGIGNGIPQRNAKNLATIESLVPPHMVSVLIEILRLSESSKWALDDGPAAPMEQKFVDDALLRVAAYHHDVKLAMEQYIESAVPELSAHATNIIKNMASSNLGSSSAQNSDNMEMFFGNGLLPSDAQRQYLRRSRLPIPPINSINSLQELLSNDRIDKAREGGVQSDICYAATDVAELMLAMHQPAKAADWLGVAVGTTGVTGSSPVGLCRRIDNLRLSSTFLSKNVDEGLVSVPDEATVSGHADGKASADADFGAGKPRPRFWQIEECICERDWERLLRLLRESIGSSVVTSGVGAADVLSANFRLSLLEDFRIDAATKACIEVSNLVHSTCLGTWTADQAAMSFLGLCQRYDIRLALGAGADRALREEFQQCMECAGIAEAGLIERCDALSNRIHWLEEKRDRIEYVRWSPFLGLLQDDDDGGESGRQEASVPGAASDVGNGLTYESMVRQIDVLVDGTCASAEDKFDRNVVSLRNRQVNACIDELIMLGDEDRSLLLSNVLEDGKNNDMTLQHGLCAKNNAVPIFLLRRGELPKAEGHNPKKRKRDGGEHNHEDSAGEDGEITEAMDVSPAGSDKGRQYIGVRGKSDIARAIEMPISIKSDEYSIMRFACMSIMKRSWCSMHKAMVLKLIVNSNNVDEDASAKGDTHRKKKFLTTLVNCCDCLERCLEFAGHLLSDDPSKCTPAHHKAVNSLLRILSANSKSKGEVILLGRLIDHIYSFDDLSCLTAIISGISHKFGSMRKKSSSFREFRFSKMVAYQLMNHMDWSEMEALGPEARLRNLDMILSQAASRMRTCVRLSGDAVGDVDVYSALALLEGDIARSMHAFDVAWTSYVTGCSLACRFGNCIDEIFAKDFGRRTLVFLATTAFSRGDVLCAVALCQCSHGTDFDTAFRFLNETERRRDMSLSNTITSKGGDPYLRCIWEIPILESIVHSYSSGGKSLENQQNLGIALQQLRCPGINIHNSDKQRLVAVASRKRNLLQLLLQEALRIGGRGRGLDPSLLRRMEL